MLAGDLEAGDEILTLDGTSGYVVRLELEKFDEYVTVYNLEVDDFHTYFIGDAYDDADASVLVHNYKGREVVTEKVGSYEQARNQAQNTVGDLGADAKLIHGKFGSQKGQVTGITSADGKRGYRIDFDSEKGSHVNVFDYSKGKGINGVETAIPFEGNQSVVDAIIKSLTRTYKGR